MLNILSQILQEENYIYFVKLSIRPKDRLIRGVQFHLPLSLSEAPYKARAKLCMDWPTGIGTKGIEPETLRGAYSKVSSQHHQANPYGLKMMLFNSQIIVGTLNHEIFKTKDDIFNFLTKKKCLE